MNRYISILRGINVSGKNKIKMEDLRILFKGLSIENVQTYIQSGNVVFDGSVKDASKLEKLIKESIKRHYGFDVPALVLTYSELKDTFTNNPFVTERNLFPDKLHVTFLSGVPTLSDTSRIIPAEYLPDEFIVNGRKVYLFCPNGYGRTKLSNNFFENKLKVTATTRNWKTITKLVELAESY